MFFLRNNRPSLLWATKAIQSFIYYAGKLFFSFARVEVRGVDIVRRFHGNAVFASNHASEFDPVVLCLALDEAESLRGRLPIIFLSREKEFYNDMGCVKATLYGGVLFRILGAYPVTPKKERLTKRVRHNTIATHISLLRNGRSVFIFPEGATTHTGKLLPAKSGVAILSRQSGRPIIPIAIEGTFCLSFADLLSGRKRVRVTFGEPIFPSYDAALYPDFSSQRRAYRERARLVMQRIQEMLLPEGENK